MASYSEIVDDIMGNYLDEKATLSATQGRIQNDLDESSRSKLYAKVREITARIEFIIIAHRAKIAEEEGKPCPKKDAIGQKRRMVAGGPCVRVKGNCPKGSKKNPKSSLCERDGNPISVDEARTKIDNAYSSDWMF